MGTGTEAPKTGSSTDLYGRLNAAQQTALSEAVVEKLKGIIGGYGELGVLSEYIAVMLQSNRPSDQIQSELEAFLQEQSAPFTNWLVEQLNKMAASAGPSEAAAEEQPADQKTKRRKRRAEREAAAAAGDAAAIEEAQAAAERKKLRREKRAASSNGNNAVVAAAAAAAAGAPPLRQEAAPARSRSRKRRTRRKEAEAGEEAGKGAGPERGAVKAKLTPNVEFLRESYHKKDSNADTDKTSASDGRWSFRADGTAGPPASAAPLGPPPGQLHYPPQPQYHYQSPHHYSAPPAAYPSAPGHSPAPPAALQPVAAPAPAPAVVATRPRYFAPKKWKVVRGNTVVRSTEKLDSAEVQKLQEGEIVEQVSPSFTLENGLVRIQIRHPSSPLFPNPIGWVTQDASAAGGPVFLEPGPEPMQKPSGGGWRPLAPSWGGAPAAWRPRGPPGSGAPPPRPSAPKGSAFGNLTWTPSN
eukprot:TRINITY_DN64861_c0_g1_i1.p1 TRINITY_DN64861_c0_g1~~TRINITY_DN64861_c0_g1_i1.p1  ORF type:complete len:469 (-),score=140.99 TRINITY_DN64861_c0_g1_i1:79-1485(-)